MKKTRALLCVLLCLLLLCLTACSGGTSSQKKKSVNFETAVSEKNTDKEIYTEKNPKEKLTRIARMDMTVLYFNKENYSVSVYDVNGRQLWKSLPEKFNGETPCILSLEVLIGTKKVVLNSQDDSLQKKLASYKIQKKGVTVTYKFEKEIENVGKMSFSVPINYEISDGTLTVSVDCAKIRNEENNENITIKRLSLLDYFGSSVSGQDGDFIFVPEGSGAIIDTSKPADKFPEISVPVYGNDLGVQKPNSNYASIGAYAVKNGENAFVALIEEGESLATVTASKLLKKSSYNKVGATFTLCNEKTENGRTYVSKKPYDGQIKISYRFLSKENATYSAMATACRELLIRNGTLSLQEAESTQSYPLVLSLIGNGAYGSEKPKIKTYTDFEEAEQIISFLRSKGISDIELRYKGVFTGGKFQGDTDSLKLSSKLGSKEELEAFSQYCSLQNIKVYPEISYLGGQKGKIKNSALSIDGKKLTETEKASNSKVYTSALNSSLTGLSALEKRTDNLLLKLGKYPFEGIYVSDIGTKLYSDFSADNTFGREEAKKEIALQSESLSPKKSLMISGGNPYSLKFADYAVDLPNTSKLSKTQYCTAVPFLQILLHGIIPFSSSAVNLKSNPDTEVLRAAEYGELLSYEFYYDAESENGDNSWDKYYYMNFATHAQENYERLRNAYADLSSKKITDHIMLRKGVYRTSFGDGVNIYVNYTTKDKKVDGVTVEARSFLKVE